MGRDLSRVSLRVTNQNLTLDFSLVALRIALCSYALLLRNISAGRFTNTVMQCRKHNSAILNQCPAYSLSNKPTVDHTVTMQVLQSVNETTEVIHQSPSED